MPSERSNAQGFYKPKTRKIGTTTPLRTARNKLDGAVTLVNKELAPRGLYVSASILPNVRAGTLDVTRRGGRIMTVPVAVFGGSSVRVGGIEVFTAGTDGKNRLADFLMSEILRVCAANADTLDGRPNG